MSTAALLLPNQLFAQHPGLAARPDTVVLFEDPLFFGDAYYPATMHKQKLWLHRASMARYRDGLVAKGFDAAIWPFERQAGACLRLFQNLRDRGVSRVIMADPVDFIAERRFRAAAGNTDITLDIQPSPGFMNTRADNLDWSAGRKRWFMAEFYKGQRRRLNVLMDSGQPAGGQWSFDEENRKKVPKALLGSLPWIDWPAHDAVDEAAKASVIAEFPDALGGLDTLFYPTSHKAASDWLAQFLERRFEHFGDYEDAIVEGENWLWHAVLTPALNIGLLTPKQVLDAALAHADRKGIPLNSVEGFIRQIIGWREFMRATYENLGVQMRTTNHWGHHRPMHRSFYNGTTGIDPLDDTIKRVLETGYCHHIERLMVLGGFMFLCEIDPDHVYRWFMEMFVDSYDWVMVPNAYAMSQHADGGLITTKPYFSGSNYIRKMSHWGKGPWADIWDGLYWRFILKHTDRLAGNPRWAMMCRTAGRMSPEVKNKHVTTAEAFLRRMT
ncbi:MULTISPECIES: cryptochrome/photolyase family protein [unclassified Ruegeria]|uniref:cryptochrome/photolyase family protein n=1 Tax=unclassified Ruegeria TaxID=2625375 RepID=UPI001488019A|nr:MULTISPECIES: cryptochrome/photolyase family protein [unclassified Ruegeria]NOE27833.1 cryptochrome/photolyase family protein [Ruegeria sp. HKCCD6157]